MTNNPTIDGVSRAKIHHLKIHRKPFDDLVSGRKTSEVRNCADREFREGDHVELFLIDETGNPANKSIVRTITHIQRGYGLPDDICVLSYAPIDAPAVERQAPPIEVARYRLKAALPGLDGRLINRPEVVIAQAYDALQSTIARLEARITQLESEKEFAAATYQAARDRIAELESGRGVVAAYRIQHQDGYWCTWGSGPVSEGDLQDVADGVISGIEFAYAAPPAPVAVVLPERKDGNAPALSNHRSYNQGWNACLDATAALNGAKK